MKWSKFGLWAYFYLSYAYSQIIVEAPREDALFERHTGTVLVLTRQELEQMPEISLENVLARYSSLFIAKQGPQSSLFLRGSNSSHVSVYLNGIKLNDPSNPNRAFDFSKISVSSLEKVEVLQGAQSVLYGGDAMGGVIRLTTKSDSLNSSARASFGRYQNIETSLSTGQVLQNVHSQTSLDYLNSQGYSLAASSANSIVTPDGRERVNLSQQLSTEYLKFSLNAHQDKFDIDRFGTDGLEDDPNNYTQDRQMQAALGWSGNFSKSLNYDYTLGSLQQIRKTFKLSDSDNTLEDVDSYRAQTFELKLNHQLSLKQWSTFFGLEQSREQAKIPEKLRAQTTGVFVQQRFDHTQFFMSLGARYEKHEYFDEIFTHALGLGFYSTERTTIKYHYATGYKAPTLFQLFDKNYGSLNLEPEKSTHHEVSLHHSHWFQVSVFQTRYRNLIGFHPQTFRSVNEGASNIRGAELQLNVLNNQHHQVSLDATVLKAIELETKKDLTRRPRQKLGARWSAQWSERWRTMLALQWVSSRAEFTGERLPAFAQVDTLLEYKQSATKSGYFKMDNLFAAENKTAAGFETGGRIWNIGFKIEF